MPWLIFYFDFGFRILLLFLIYVCLWGGVCALNSVPET